MYDLEQIKAVLPHRYPFLLIDRVLEVRDGEYSKALKNVTGNEQVFQGHFPDFPVFPGVMIVEAMAQTAGFVINSHPDAKNKKAIVFFAGIEKAKFRQPVVPGDQLILETTLTSCRRGFWVFEGLATVEGKRVAQAEVKLMVPPQE